MTRIAILHPNLSIASELQFQLRSAQEFQVVHITKERDRLFEALDVLDINMVIVSSQYEGGETLPICQELNIFSSDIGVLVYSSPKDCKYAKRMLHRGASGCILDEDAPEILYESLRVIANKGSYISSASAFYLLGLKQAIDENKRQYKPQLSEREKDVMRAILEERTTGEIAEMLKISFGTVETHRRNMLAKVGARNTAGLVKSCYEMCLLE